MWRWVNSYDREKMIIAWNFIMIEKIEPDDRSSWWAGIENKQSVKSEQNNGRGRALWWLNYHINKWNRVSFIQCNSWIRVPFIISLHGPADCSEVFAFWVAFISLLLITRWRQLVNIYDMSGSSARILFFFSGDFEHLVGDIDGHSIGAKTNWRFTHNEPTCGGPRVVKEMKILQLFCSCAVPRLAIFNDF